MQLAYGRFDPEINPPPFSDWSKSFTAVEIDLFQYFSWKPKVSAYFESWIKKNKFEIIPRIGIRTQRSRAEYEDALTVWREAYQEQTRYFSIHSGRKEWSHENCIHEVRKLSSVENCFFEWGKEDSLQSMEFLTALDFFTGWVIDPDWHFASIKSLNNVALNFKLHGWSKERWVRRYGPAQASRILRGIRNQDGSIFTLSHSGKVVEAQIFIEKV